MPLSELAAAVRTIPDFPKPGIQFKDITPIFADANLLRQATTALAAPFKSAGITKVVGIEARGFILGSLLAHALNAGFVPIRKKGKLPYETVSAEYELEYGVDIVEMHIDALHKGDNVLIHDDVIATGGTAKAAAELVAHTGASLAGYAFLIELGFLQGRDRLLPSTPIFSALQY